MKSITLLSLVLLFAVQIGQAQIKLGIVGGFSIASSTKDNIELGNEAGRKIREVAFVDHNSTPSIGIALTSDFGPLFATAEAQYRKSAYKMNITNFLGIDRPNEIVSVTSNTVQMSVTGGLKFGAVRLGVGPVFNFRTSALPAMSDEMFSTREHRLQTAFSVSLAYDLTNNIRLGIKYEQALTRVGDQYVYRGKRLPIDSRLNYITINAGYFF